MAPERASMASEGARECIHGNPGVALLAFPFPLAFALAGRVDVFVEVS